MLYSISVLVAALAFANSVVGSRPGCPNIMRYCANGANKAGNLCKASGHLKAPSTKISTSCINTESACRNFCATEKSCKSFEFNQSTKACSWYKVSSRTATFVPDGPSQPVISNFWDKTCYTYSHFHATSFSLGVPDSFGEIGSYFLLNPADTTPNQRTMLIRNGEPGASGVDPAVLAINHAGRLYTIDSEGHTLYANVLPSEQYLYMSTPKIIASNSGISVTCRIDLGNVAKCNSTMGNRKQFLLDLGTGNEIGLVERKTSTSRDSVGAQCANATSSEGGSST